MLLTTTRNAELLRTAAGELPAAPGVYVFLGEDERVPLYIGKSVNIRGRVLSHLRAGRRRMLREARTLRHFRTAGAVGALLLEAQLIKEQRPLYNKRLKRSRELCSLRLADGVPQVVFAREMDFAGAPGLYGLFRHRRQALEKLQAIADEQQLCLGLLGLEQTARGRGCFRSGIGRCAGACRGDEPLAAHEARLREALTRLAVVSWPWPGAVGLVEDGRDLRQVHVVRNWCYLGSVEREEQAHELVRVAPGFDVDGYRILYKPLLARRRELIQFSIQAGVLPIQPA